MGASAISHFPGYIIQNEKNVGNYRALAAAQEICVVRGVIRDASDQIRGKLIERLLCTGNSGAIPEFMQSEMAAAIQPFAERGLARLAGGNIVIEPAGVAYARVVASLFDAYRKPSVQQFSPAV